MTSVERVFGLQVARLGNDVNEAALRCWLIDSQQLVASVLTDLGYPVWPDRNKPSGLVAELDVTRGYVPVRGLRTSNEGWARAVEEVSSFRSVSLRYWHQVEGHPITAEAPVVDLRLTRNSRIGPRALLFLAFARDLPIQHMESSLADGLIRLFHAMPRTLDIVTGAVGIASDRHPEMDEAFAHGVEGLWDMDGAVPGVHWGTYLTADHMARAGWPSEDVPTSPDYSVKSVLGEGPPWFVQARGEITSSGALPNSLQRLLDGFRVTWDDELSRNSRAWMPRLALDGMTNVSPMTIHEPSSVVIECRTPVDTEIVPPDPAYFDLDFGAAIGPRAQQKVAGIVAKMTQWTVDEGQISFASDVAFDRDDHAEFWVDAGAMGWIGVRSIADELGYQLELANVGLVRIRIEAGE